MAIPEIMAPPARPATRLPGGRMGLVLVALALSFVALQGLTALGALFSEAQVSQNNVPAITLPTVTTAMTPPQYAAAILGSLSLNDRIAQMIMVKLLGTNFSVDEAQMVEQEHVGGVIAFADAIVAPGQVRSLTSSLKAYSALPLFIATDQEGGPVNRFSALVGPRPSEAEIGATGQPSAAEQAGAQTATDFATYGFNLNFAPVVDINEPGINNPQLAGRMYSSDPATVARFADAYLTGFQQSGQFTAVIKHFPGLGATQTDPHRGLPIVYKSQAQLDAHEFVPYRDLFALGNVRAVMVTHELLPEIDAQLPSTLSKKIITGLLRDDLGYNGLIITDSLDMFAIAAKYPIDQAALLAAEAGADVLMGASSPDEVQATIQTIAAAVQNGALPQAQIDASVQRILTLKIQMGLIPMPKAPTPTISPTPPALPHHAKL